MSHGVQGDSVQVFAIFRDQVELLDGSLETGGLFSNAVFFLAGRSVPQACAYTPRASEPTSGTRTKPRLPPFWVI